MIHDMLVHKSRRLLPTLSQRIFPVFFVNSLILASNSQFLRCFVRFKILSVHQLAFSFKIVCEKTRHQKLSLPPKVGVPLNVFHDGSANVHVHSNLNLLKRRFSRIILNYSKFASVLDVQVSPAITSFPF